MGRAHKSLNVYGTKDIRAVENAIDAAREVLGEDATDGDAIVHVCQAYTGWYPPGADQDG